jgi:hypothetical protein
MKKHKISFFAYLILGFLLASNVNAQAPEGFIYQAEARNTNGVPIPEATLQVRITIRSDDPGGIVVWEGEHEVTTDKYGLFSLIVGEGTGGAYEFTEINWANGTYYLNVMIFDCGAWVDMGTSQLLSVPYALHAKTVENEIDPLYSASQAVYITEADIANLDNLSGINTGDQDISGLATLTAIEDTASAIRSDMPDVKFYSIGDYAQGGIVFWVDESGQHGLVCAKEDQSFDMRWFAGTYGYTWANGDGPFSGETNTAIIIAAQISIGDDGSNYAARNCNELQISQGGKTYGDWYLPSKKELYLLYVNKEIIDATAMAHDGIPFANTSYCSSTEYNDRFAWCIYLGDGNQYYGSKSGSYRVRAVRAF